MLLAAILVVGFIGISSPSSIFAQYYNDYESQYSQYYDGNYEKSYEKYMKNDDSKPNIIKIKCNNISKNPSNDNPVIENAIGLSDDDPQSGQRIDRISGDGNSDGKGDFVSICQNNNSLNIVNPTLIVNNGTTINNNTLSIENNNANQQSIDLEQNGCANTASQSSTISTTGNNSNISNSGNNQASQTNDCQIDQQQTSGNQTQSIQNNNTGVITTNSIANVGQPMVESEGIKSKSIGGINGILIHQQGNLPVDITLSQTTKSSNTSPSIIAQELKDSHDLTAMEKITKLKQQWLSQLP